RESALIAESAPGPADHARAALPRSGRVLADLGRAIGALGIDDNNLVGPSKRAQAAADVAFFIAGQDEHRNRNTHAPPNLRHSAKTGSTPIIVMHRCACSTQTSTPHQAGIPGDASLRHSSGSMKNLGCRSIGYGCHSNGCSGPKSVTVGTPTATATWRGP